MKLDCDIVLSMVKGFFSGTITRLEKESIINHLLFCPKCLIAYQEYATKTSKDFDIIDVIDLWGQYQEEELTIARRNRLRKDKAEEMRSKVVSILAKEDREIIEDKWTRAAVSWNIPTLLALAAFRDLNNEHNLDDDSGTVDYLPFYKFIIKKHAQKVDLLEKCLIKEIPKETSKEKGNRKRAKKGTNEEL